ncbi:MAG TPA: hypothetical protein VK470_11480 [Bacteroidota bacterium]|nr:hypothetical protein [Bacteroidota bacterium]
MKISMIDGSNYFKGLLVLIARDREVTEPEIELMKRLGKSLGFEKKFCQNAINEILDNTYVDTTPPEFSNKELAMMFIKDGLTISFSDHLIHPFEEAWLNEAAVKNGIDSYWVGEQMALAVTRRGLDAPLEADSLTLEYI